MRLSYSTIDLYNQCPRWFYNAKILKLDAPQDKKYMYRGSLVHTLLEKWYKKSITDINKLRQCFDTGWVTYRLNQKMPKDMEKTWEMVLNGIEMNLTVTDVEYKFRFTEPDYVGYADMMNKDTHVIRDWKTSTWRKNVSEECYRKQMSFYAWAYYKTFGIIPTTCVDFLKVKKTVNYSFLKEELLLVDKEIRITNTFIEEHKNKYDYKRCSDNPKKCPFFCPYKEECFSKNALTFTINKSGPWLQIEEKISPILSKMLSKKFGYEVEGATFIKGQGLWKLIECEYDITTLSFIKKNVLHACAVTPNIPAAISYMCANFKSLPLNFRSNIMGKCGSIWDGNIRLYDTRMQRLGVGFKHRLIQILKGYSTFVKKDCKIVFNDNTKKHPILEKYTSSITLRGYQKDAVKKILDEKVGIIKVATGGGKTEIAIEAMRVVKQKCLFVVNRIELLEQTKERIESNSNCKVGTIQGNIIETDKQITIATIQTLYNNYGSLCEFLNDINMVIFDETHVVASKSYGMINKQIKNAEYRIGLSATPFRDDGKDMEIEQFCGNAIFTKTPMQLMKEEFIMFPKIRFFKYGGIANTSTSYHEDVKYNIVENEDRNNKIKELIKENKGKQILVLVKQIVHGESLQGYFPESFYLNGSVNKINRKKKYRLFKEGIIKVLFVTSSIAQQGLDIKNLDIIINASANKGDIASIQILGRVLRICVGKKDAWYFDFLDKGEFTKPHSRKRHQIFKERGYDIKIIE